MSQKQRFSVLIGLHERRLAEARRRIGELESLHQRGTEQVADLEHDQLQAAAGVDYLMHEQYLNYCAHLQIKIGKIEQQLNEISQAIEQTWDEFRNIKRELQVFEKLQLRDAEAAKLTEKRRHQNEMIDHAILNWLGESA